MEEVNNNFNKYDMNSNYIFFNKLYSNIERMIREIKRYAYGKIIFIGLYNPTNYFSLLVSRIEYYKRRLREYQENSIDLITEEVVSKGYQILFADKKGNITSTFEFENCHLKDKGQ